MQATGLVIYWENIDVSPIKQDYMDRDRLGGVPFEAKKEKKKVRLRFFPKGENPKDPNSVVFTMLMDKTDKEKILKLFE